MVMQSVVLNMSLSSVTIADVLKRLPIRRASSVNGILAMRMNASRISVVSTKSSFMAEAESGRATTAVAGMRGRNNVMEAHPEIVARLRQHCDAWWDDVTPLLVNEDAWETAPEVNPFREQYEMQTGTTDR